jgi:transcription elongation factor GreA
MPVADKVLYVTDAGKATLEAEIVCLQHLRAEVARERSRPPLWQGARWPIKDAASTEIKAIDREISRLNGALQEAEVISEEDGRVGVGSRVGLRDDEGRRKEVYIVGPVAANPGSGFISFTSTLGNALLGRRSGEVVEVYGGNKRWWARILSVASIKRVAVSEA